MIIDITRSYVLVSLDDRTLTVSTEMLVPTPGMSDYLVYGTAIRVWDPPFDNETVDSATKNMIIEEVREALSKLGRVVEVL